MTSLIALVVFGLALGPACAHRSEGAAQEQARPAKEKKAEGVPPPAGSALAKVQVGMTDSDVRRILGEPTTAGGHITGKQFIPYYYGPDTERIIYQYKGKGRVEFSRNRYSGSLKVVRVDYDPTEPGN